MPQYSNDRRPQQNERPEPEQFWGNSGYKRSWITDGIDKDLIPFAEKMGIYMANNKLTKSKIRSIYGEIKRIQMGDFDKERPHFTC